MLVLMDLHRGDILREEAPQDRTYETWKALVDQRLDIPPIKSNAACKRRSGDRSVRSQAWVTGPARCDEKSSQTVTGLSGSRRLAQCLTTGCIHVKTAIFARSGERHFVSQNPHVLTCQKATAWELMPTKREIRIDAVFRVPIPEVKPPAQPPSTRRCV